MNKIKEFDNYKLIIITMDDLIINLNELRYDFLQLAYPKTFSTISFKEFTYNIGNVDESDTHSLALLQEMHNKIEGYIFDKSNLHNIKVKESAGAFLNFCQSRGIKILLLTSHDKIKAKELLRIKNLLQDVDQVISLDEYQGSFSYSKIIYSLCSLYQLTIDNILCVSSLNTILSNSMTNGIDSIFIPDNKNSYFDSTVLASMNSLFDLLQYGLFGKYTSVELYKDFLGFDDNMDHNQKYNRYNYLKIKYQNNSDILPIVDEIYTKSTAGDNSNTQMFENIIKDIDLTLETSSKDELFADSFDESNEFQLDDITLDENDNLIDNDSLIGKNIDFNLNDTTIKEVESSIEKDATISNTKPIKQVITNVEANKINDDLVNSEEEKITILTVIIDVLINTFYSIAFVSIVSIIYLCFYHEISSNKIIKSLFDAFVLGYYHICAFITQNLLDSFPNFAKTILGAVSFNFINFITMSIIISIIINLIKLKNYILDNQQY